MNPELIAIIGAAITLGTAMFGSARWFRGSVEKRLDSTEDRLRNEIKATEGRLEGSLNGAIGGLRDDLNGIRDDMKEGDAKLETAISRLRADMKEGDGKLETAIGGLRTDMTTGFLNLTDRVSRVEGVIAGRFPGVPNPAQETRQEGVA